MVSSGLIRKFQIWKRARQIFPIVVTYLTQPNFNPPPFVIRMWKEIAQDMAMLEMSDFEVVAALQNDPDAEFVQSNVQCSICKKPSIHDVCLACEEKYQAERHKVRAQILRAKRAGVPATLTLPEWIDTLNSHHWKCVYCQIRPYVVIEHFVPITQGGGTTKDNCVPSCVSCNSIKGDKHPDRIASKFKHK